MKYLIAFIFLLCVFSCASPGPKVTVCVVSAQSEVYDCIDGNNTKTQVPFSQDPGLICSSPHDLEEALKACKAGNILTVTSCTLKYANSEFLCVQPNGSQFFLLYPDAENYVCLSGQDKQRLLERCHHLYEYEQEYDVDSLIGPSHSTLL